MSKLIVHVDGSRVSAGPPHNRMAFGWGIVALTNDRMMEECGAVMCDLGMSGYHEHVAFVNAVLLAHRLGFDFEDVSIQCDDEIFGHATTWLHPGNLKAERSAQVLDRLNKTTKRYFDERAKSLTLEAFSRSRITCVQGHSFHVYQERVDHLAKRSGQLHLGVATKPLESFDDWLKIGLKNYKDDNRDVHLIWRAAFVEPDIEQNVEQEADQDVEQDVEQETQSRRMRP